MTNHDIKTLVATSYADDFRRLYFCAYAVVRNFPEPADAARDIVNDAYIQALRGKYTPVEGCTFYTWVYGVCKNLALNHIARHEQAKRIRDSKGGNVGPCADRCDDGVNARTAESRWGVSDVTPRPFTGPERAYFNKERRELVRDALAQHCTPRQVLAWELCKLDGLTTTAAASMMDVSQPTAHRALNAALVAIRGHVAAMTC
jgi:RNA polymerase sigma factor (sigma-70 family)